MRKLPSKPLNWRQIRLPLLAPLHKRSVKLCRPSWKLSWNAVLTNETKWPALLKLNARHVNVRLLPLNGALWKLQNVQLQIDVHWMLLNALGKLPSTADTLLRP